jgi:hypothetical protein
MTEKFFIEVACQQKSHHEARVCGDVFLTKRIREEGRIIAVLSDGMGHGIRATLPATLTATLAVNLLTAGKDIPKLAALIMDTLPVDSIRQMSYATFTILDISDDGEVMILEYDNPQTLIFRGTIPFEPAWNCVVLEGKHSGKEILTTRFTARKEDRIVFCSDGVVQSGLGGENLPSGWGAADYRQFLRESIREDHEISAAELSQKVINRANLNDGFHPNDDISCGVIYFREPRRLMICTGPPVNEADDAMFAGILKEFPGKKIISGASTADLIAREWQETITDSQVITDPGLPPVSRMEGVDLITEGILTLSKTSELLKQYTSDTRLGKGPADGIIKLILESDSIDFLVGTRINEAHQDPTLPMELELRRTVVHRIARTLEEKFLKKMEMRFF